MAESAAGPPAGRRAFFCLGTGSDEHGALNILAWEVPAVPEALAVLTETLTEAYGEPAEWLSDERPDGSVSMLFFEGGNR